MSGLTIPDAIVVSVFTICLTIIVIKLYSGRCKKCGKLKNHEVN